MRKILLFLIMIAILSASTSAVPTNGVSYYELFTTTDSWNGYTLTNSGASSVASYPSFAISGNGAVSSANFVNAESDYMYRNSVVSGFPFSVNAWFRASSVTIGYIWMIGDSGSNNDYFAILHDGDHISIIRKTAAAADIQDFTNTTYSTGTWYMVTAVFSSATDTKYYLDGKTIGLDTDSKTFPGSTDIFCLGALCRLGIGSYFDGYIDEVQVFSKTLIYAEIQNLYNYGYNEAPAGSTNPNIRINLYDLYDNSSIDNFSVVLSNGTGYATTNGTAYINNVTIGNYTFDIVNISGDTGDFFNLSGYINASANSSTYTKLFYAYQSIINFNSYELITGSLLPASSYYVNSTSGSSFKLEAALNYQVLTENAGYFNKTMLFNVAPLDNLTINITGVYSSVINISATNKYTGNPILNFSGWVYHPGSSNNRTYNTTTGNYSFPMIPGNFTVFLDGEGYSISSDNYQNTTINETAHNLSFSLYSNNSILINIRNENTGLTITDNITITVTGANETQYWTTNGTYFLQDLIDGNYSIKFSGGNYTLRTYIVTVAERSTQLLNAYLTSSSSTVIMSYIDAGSGLSLEGASASMSRLIGGVWTVIQSKESDITGRIQFSYIPDVKYKFTSTLTDYDPKTFYLDPVIFDSYNVLMNKAVTISNAPGYQGVAITISPSQYFNDGRDNFSITFSSPDGLLSSYDYNITFPTGGAYTGSGANAYGGTFERDINITGAGITDSVVLEYCYDTTIGSEKCYRRVYSIINPITTAGVFTDNKDTTYGLGLFERILVTVIVVIIVTGIISLLGGIMIGAPIGLILMGYLTLIGFMPLWAALPSLLVGFVLIGSRST